MKQSEYLKPSKQIWWRQEQLDPSTHPRSTISPSEETGTTKASRWDLKSVSGSSGRGWISAAHLMSRDRVIQQFNVTHSRKFMWIPHQKTNFSWFTCQNITHETKYFTCLMFVADVVRLHTNLSGEGVGGWMEEYRLSIHRMRIPGFQCREGG